MWELSSHVPVCCIMHTAEKFHKIFRDCIVSFPHCRFSVSLCFQVWYKSLWYTKCGVAWRGCEHMILVPTPNFVERLGLLADPLPLLLPSLLQRAAVLPPCRRLCCTSQQWSIGFSRPGRVRIGAFSSLFQETNVDVNTFTKSIWKSALVCLRKMSYSSG